MNDLIRPVADTFAFNARMIALGTSDLKPEDAVERGNGGRGSSISFLVGHTAARWAALARDLDAALAELTAERLLAPPPVSYPTPDQTVRGGLAFICWHESYHIGQIGMLRTGLGYPSLRSLVASAAD